MKTGLVYISITSGKSNQKGIYMLPPLRSSSPRSLPPLSSPLSLLFSLEVVFLYSSMYWTSSTNIDKNVNGGGRNKFGSKNWIPAYARAYLELEYVNVVWRRQSITNTDLSLTGHYYKLLTSTAYPDRRIFFDRWLSSWQ